MNKLAIAILALALVALPAVGYAVTQNPSRDTGNYETYLEEAADEMGLNLEQAKSILEQARELRRRMMAKCKGISYEEMQERIEEFRNREDRPQGRRGQRRFCPQVEQLPESTN